MMHSFVHGRQGRLVVMAALMLTLGACGSRKSLKPTPDQPPAPPTAYGADKPATPDEMIESVSREGSQARPDRSAEPLRKSQERADDPFDIPPN